MRSSQLNSLIDKLFVEVEQKFHQPIYYFLDGRGQEYAHFTYGSLLNSVQRIGRWLVEQTEMGDRVAIQLPTSPEFISTFLACLYTNRIPVSLSSPTRKHNCEHYQRIFQDANVSLVVTSSIVKSLYAQENLENLHVIKTFPSADNIDPLGAPISRQGNDIAFLQYTSGSTSFPKGVMVSHENILANQKMIQQTFGHSTNSIGLAWVPLFHDMGLIGSVFQPLYIGFPCYFMSPVTFLQRPKLWLKIISDKKITTTGGPNFAYDLCVKRINPTALQDVSLSTWDVAYNGAEHIKSQTLQEFSKTFSPYGFKETAFLPCYGLAEATLIVSGIDKSEHPIALTIPCGGDESLDADASQSVEFTRTVVSNGQIMPGLSLRIINPHTLLDCPTHHIGEIWVAGPSITMGYWQKPEKNHETFIFRDNLRFLRTGDLGFLDSEHRLYITGRLKDLIVIEGKNYYPYDIEETTRQAHPGLQDVNGAVFAISKGNTQKLVIVHEVVRRFWPQIHHYFAEILEAVRQSVYDRYHLPIHDIVLVPSHSIPKTTSGKIQRQRTKLLYLLDKLEGVSKSTKASEI